MSDVVIIGAGHNGLIAAAQIARAGYKPIVLERAERVGGCAITTEIAPGFRCPTLAHSAAIDPAILRGLDLPAHGLEIVRPAAHACTPMPDGRALVLWSDTSHAAREIAAFSKRDAEQYPRFLSSFAGVSKVIGTLNNAVPPSIDAPSSGDLLTLLKTSLRLRALDRSDGYRFLRWLPMAAADLVGESFESEPLRVTVGAGGVIGSFLGPRSAGSGAVLLHLGAGEGHPVGAGWFARGGPGALSEALAKAARQAGATIRTGAEVQTIAVTDAGATGVVLAGGESMTARCVISGLDPKRTLLALVDPLRLGPELRRRLKHVRTRGTLAKVNYAVSSTPGFTGLAGRSEDERTAALSGRIRLAADLDVLERAFDRAKYGTWSDEPWIELTIPSLTDPAMAPAGRHVISAYVQFAPYDLRGTNWDAERERLGDATTAAIARCAPGFASTVLARQVITPLDLERTYGLTGGQIFHGELALDQLYVARPLLGWARYRTPIRNLYLCGSGTHPGTGLDGRSGRLAASVVVHDLRRGIVGS